MAITDIDYGPFEVELSGIAFADLVSFVLTQEQCRESAHVSLLFVRDEEMAELNERFRGIAAPTDVLSFECDGLDQDVSDSLSEKEISSDNQPFILGDIIIAPEVARAQSKEFGTTFEEELGFLLIHGLLHLCSYDHMNDADAEEMEKREQELFRQWFATDKLLR